MAEGNERVFQFKVTLRGVKPPIWRRIKVPENFTFTQLHRAIQMAMGWRDCHVHRFKMCNRIIFDHTQDLEPNECWSDENKTYIKGYFTAHKDTALYEYDLVDRWCHTVELESIEPAEPGNSYPKCIKGRRACPPEDCGGTENYEDLVEALSSPFTENYELMNNWLARIGYYPFDPDRFSCVGLFDDWCD